MFDEDVPAVGGGNGEIVKRLDRHSVPIKIN
jgi:hypothetical protein